MKNAGIPPIHGDGAHPKIEMRGRTPDSAGFWPLLQLSTEAPAISRQSPAISIIHFSIKFFSICQACWALRPNHGVCRRSLTAAEMNVHAIMQINLW